MIIIIVLAYLQPYKSGSDVFTLYDYTEKTGTRFIDITINGHTVNVDCFQNNAVYETMWLSTEKPTSISVGDFNNCKIYVNGSEIYPNTEQEFTISDLRKDEFINFVWHDELKGFQTNFSIRTLPESIPDVSILKNQYVDIENQSQIYCLTITSHNCLLKMDRDGNILYYRLADAPRNFYPCTNSKGEIRYAFVEKATEAVENIFRVPVYQAVVMDENFDEIDKIKASDYNEDFSQGISLYEYGFQYIDDFDYCIATKCWRNYTAKVINENRIENYRVISPNIKRISHGTVIWSNNVSIPMEPLNFTNKLEFVEILNIKGLIKTDENQTINALLENANEIISFDINNGNIIETQKLPVDLLPCSLAYKDDGFNLLLSESDYSAVYSYDKDNGWVTENIFGAEILQSGSVDYQNRNCLISYGKCENKAVLLTEFDASGMPIFELVCNTNKNEDIYIDRAYYMISE